MLLDETVTQNGKKRLDSWQAKVLVIFIFSFVIWNYNKAFSWPQKKINAAQKKGKWALRIIMTADHLNGCSKHGLTKMRTQLWKITVV